MNARSPSVAPGADEAKGYTLVAMPATAFGKYVLVGKLGHGGMAEVNLAVTGGKGGFRKLFVIKRLHAHLEAEPGFVDMFLDEARLAAQLDHPHCVQTVEVGEANGQHFLAMEYLDGQGLERLLRMAAAKNMTLPPAIAARICVDALDGLGYAHELTGFDGQPLGVVHRDISPQNLFVTYTGVVKVLDFGIAKAASNVVETRTGVIKGKYAYIAPEQALANQIDARADLWSMGVVFWELLTTRRLFKSVNELATLQETLRGEIRPPSAVEPGVPPELDAIAMRALQRDPALRYPTAAAFKADLEAWLESQPHAPDRRAISTLMKERFSDIIDVQKQKLRECLAAVAQGEKSVERLIDAGGVLASTELAALQPSSPGIAVAPSAHGPYPTPTPYPSNPYASPYPSNPYVAPPPTPYPSNPWGAMTPGPMNPGAMNPGAMTPNPMAPVSGIQPPSALPPLPHEPTMRLQPPPEERRRRSVGWWLVGFGALALAAVLGAIWLRPLMRGEEVAGEGPGGVVIRTVPPTGEPTGEPSAAGEPVAVGEPRAAGEPIAAGEPSTGEPTTAPSVPLAPTAGGTETVALDPAIAPLDPVAPTVEEGTREGATSGGGSHRRPRTGSSTTETEPPPPVVSPPPPPASGDGFLTLATSPWTSVTCGGRSLGETPLMRVSLPAGHHSCRLVNADEGISETYEVDIRPGETTRLRLGLR